MIEPEEPAPSKPDIEGAGTGDDLA